MPKIVDHEQVRSNIVDAFRQCLAVKSFDTITLRDIARQAQMPHSTILNYFKNKNEIIMAFVSWVAENTFRDGHNWLKEHPSSMFASKEEYLVSFLDSCSKQSNEEKLIYTGALNIYILSRIHEDIAGFVKEEKNIWVNQMTKILCRELQTSYPNSLLGSFTFSCISAICLNTFNNWLEKKTYRNLLHFYAKTILQIADESSS